MIRTFLLAVGVVLWMAAGVDFFAHLREGDLLAPAVMAVILVVWFSLRVVPARLARVAESTAEQAVDPA
jgi:hypothetical protein